MNNHVGTLFFIISVAIFILLLAKPYLVRMTFHLQTFEDEESILIPYAHVVPQLEWIVKHSGNKTKLGTGPVPKIYYDRKILFHSTTSDGCRYTCLFTNSTADLRKGDVAVFSDKFHISQAKKLKRNGVIIGYESRETPPHMPSLTQDQMQAVSLLLTYQHQSPVPFLYPMFLRNKRPTVQFTQEERDRLRRGDYRHLLPTYHHARTGLIAWMVSNHHPRNNRKEFADAISKFIKVDVYGSRPVYIPDTEGDFAVLATKYKFYLAFENSNCRDYITEKLFTNALGFNMVPIVLGTTKADYMARAPPNSYIHVDDFPTIKSMTDYLLYLDKNDTAYATYFAWKLEGRIVEYRREDCRLCGFTYQLRDGKATLPTTRLDYYKDVKKQCFQRPLLPLE